MRSQRFYFPVKLISFCYELSFFYVVKARELSTIFKDIRAKLRSFLFLSKIIDCVFFTGSMALF